MEIKTIHNEVLYRHHRKSIEVVNFEVGDENYTKLVNIIKAAVDEKNFKSGRLNFTNTFNQAVSKSDIVFICVGTPTKNKSYAADLSQIYNVAKKISKCIKKFKLIVNKSTVPVTTGDQIEKIISGFCHRITKSAIFGNFRFFRNASSNFKIIP